MMMSVELKIHNDGKEKYQSFEAWVDGIDCNRGYGATEAEAIEEYKRELKIYSTRSTFAIQNIELGSFETVKVDFAGRQLQIR